MRILVSAFACHPNPGGNIALFPGEAIGGWNLIRHINRRHQVWIITHLQNRTGIESYLLKRPARHLHFCYLALPRWLNVLNKIEFGIRIYYYFWQLRAYFLSRRLHRKHFFEIAHHLTFNNDWMPSFIGALLPVPFIWGPIGGGQSTPKDFRAIYSRGGRLAETFRDLAQWVGRNLLLSRRRCVKKARIILVCNKETRARIPVSERYKALYFPVNGIDRKDLGASPPRLSSPSFRVLMAGRLIRLKAFDLGLEAFHVFIQKHPQARLEVVGKGPEEGQLRLISHVLDLDKSTRFIPWLSRKALLNRMRRSSVFLFPSLRDGGGAVVVEAMAQGVPVICLNSGGPGFHIQPAWGIKIEPRNPRTAIEDMAQALERLYAKRALRRRLGAAAQNKVKEYYLWSKLAIRLEEIYISAASKISKSA
jgi:glycosyltransferase involved in cell wall biosynthesis